jgi:hypothetical protein
MKVYLQDITVNNGNWLTLPLKQELNPSHEYMIYDHELPFEVSQYENVEELSKKVERLQELNLDFNTIKALDQCCDSDLLQKLTNEDYSIIELGEDERTLSDYAYRLYQEGYSFSDNIESISDELLDFIDWESVWREYNICMGWKSVPIDNKWYLVNI